MQLLHYFEEEIIALLPFSVPIPSLGVQLGFFLKKKGASDNLIFKEGPGFHFCL